MFIPVALKHTTMPASENDCAIICTRSLLKYWGSRVNWLKIAEHLNANEYGYNIFEIAEQLLQQGCDVQVGHHDTDILTSCKHSLRNVSLRELEKMIPALKASHSPHLESLVSTIRFLKKYPDKLTLRPLGDVFLEGSVKKKIPVQIHVDMIHLTGDKNHTLHSVIVNGFTDKSFYVLDPLIGQRTVLKKKIIKAWGAAGNYFLYVDGAKH